jgi:cell division protein FtsB
VTGDSASAHRSIGRRLVGLGLVSVALYYAVWGGEYSLFDLRRIRQQQEAEVARIEGSRIQVDSLRELSTRLESDPATIEAVARERFGMIRQGEVLYRFVEVDSAAAEGVDGAPAGTGP